MVRSGVRKVPRGRAAKRIVGAQGKYKKWDPYCVRGSGGMPLENFEIYML